MTERPGRYSPGERPPTLSLWRFRLTLAASVVLIVAVITMWWAEERLGETLAHWARVHATTMATHAINRAIDDELSEWLDRDDIVEVTMEAGELPVLRYKMGVLNQTMTRAVDVMIAEVDAVTEQHISLPIGDLTGMRIFAAKGPVVKLPFMRGGSVIAEPKVEVSTAGINQIAHRMYMDVEVQMLVIAPFDNVPVVVKQPVLLSDIIISGHVPDTFVHLEGYSGSLSEWMALHTATPGAFSGIVVEP